MKKRDLLLVSVSILLTTSFVFSEQNTSLESTSERTADDLVQSKKQENINYKQLMELLGKGSTLIHEGILRENSAMVSVGTDLIMFHPAPNHKPWEIVAKSEQEDFKKTLLVFDKILHDHAEAIITNAEENKWLQAAESEASLTQACTSCHMAWKPKVIQSFGSAQSETTTSK